MFSLALGHAENCEKLGCALIVDWSRKELLYRGPPGEPNVWTAFFRQPAEFVMEQSVLLQALQQGQFKATTRQENVFGAYRGVVQGYGGITRELASKGRALCRRNISLNDKTAAQLQKTYDHLLDGRLRWLAVHIRRSDKACEAKANFQLSDNQIMKRIYAQCQAWDCNGVFLCSDDAALKHRLTLALRAEGVAGRNIAVSVYPSSLPADASQAPHFDTSLDAYQKAEDIVMEALLMARGCYGLLSTYSNVSASVVYLSPDEYPFTSFSDTIGIDMV